jgi:hypothetical protein
MLKYKKGKEINERYVNSFDENDLKSMFNLVLPEPELYKIPYSHYGDGTIDFNVYIITGLKVKEMIINFYKSCT